MSATLVDRLLDAGIFGAEGAEPLLREAAKEIERLTKERDHEREWAVAHIERLTRLLLDDPR